MKQLKQFELNIQSWTALLLLDLGYLLTVKVRICVTKHTSLPGFSVCVCEVQRCVVKKTGVRRDWSKSHAVTRTLCDHEDNLRASALRMS